MSDHKRSKPADYTIGYQRPPKASQHMAGKNGSPKGRPKDSRPTWAALQDIIRLQIAAKAIPAICATELSDELMRTLLPAFISSGRNSARSFANSPCLRRAW